MDENPAMRRAWPLLVGVLSLAVSACGSNPDDGREPIGSLQLALAGMGGAAGAAGAPAGGAATGGAAGAVGSLPRCASSADCTSGFCVDGVCCDTACTGQCEACDVAGSEGTCNPVPAAQAPHGARTPCVSDGSTCGGSCDGSTRAQCAYPTDVCRPGSCDASGIATAEASCLDGACPPVVQRDCTGYGCDASATQCAGPCATDPAACPAGEYCSAGLCVPTQTAGIPCGSAAECGTGNCVDGVCCDTACTDQCAACNVSGSVGTCTAAGGAPDGGACVAPNLINAVDEGTCGCRVPGGSRAPNALAALLAALMLCRARVGRRR
jgi:hypothetical protein